MQYSKIHSCAKSIARWTWRNYTGAQHSKDIGACHREGLISPSMTKKDRQRVGGKYGASKNAQSKREAVLAALHDLREVGQPLVISKLAADLGMSRNTVKKYLPKAAVDSAKSVGGRPPEKVVKTVPIRVWGNKKPEKAQTSMYGLPGPGSETWAILPNGTPVPKIWYSGVGLDLSNLLDAPANILHIARKRLPISMKHLQGLESVFATKPPQNPCSLIIEDNFPDTASNLQTLSYDDIDVPAFLS
jgi:hypothetical protein